MDYKNKNKDKTEHFEIMPLKRKVNDDEVSQREKEKCIARLGKLILDQRKKQKIRFIIRC